MGKKKSWFSQKKLGDEKNKIFWKREKRIKNGFWKIPRRDFLKNFENFLWVFSTLSSRKKKFWCPHMSKECPCGVTRFFFGVRNIMPRAPRPTSCQNFNKPEPLFEHDFWKVHIYMFRCNFFSILIVFLDAPCSNKHIGTRKGAQNKVLRAW